MKTFIHKLLSFLKGKHLERQAKRDGKTESVTKNRMSEKQIKMAKIDNETENTKVTRVDKKLSTQILEGRKEKIDKKRPCWKIKHEAS